MVQIFIGIIVLLDENSYKSPFQFNNIYSSLEKFNSIEWGLLYKLLKKTDADDIVSDIKKTIQKYTIQNFEGRLNLYSICFKIL